MTHATNMPARTVGSGTLSALRALAARQPADIAALRRTAQKQAARLRRLLPNAGDLATQLPHLLPNIQIDIVDDSPVPGISFWGARRWHVLIRACDPVHVQEQAILHALKHIIDHPMRRRITAVKDADWEAVADHFASEVRADRPGSDKPEKKGGATCT